MKSKHMHSLISTLTIAGLSGITLALTVSPWLLSLLFSPLQPPELAETPTAYAAARLAAASGTPSSSLSHSTVVVLPLSTEVPMQPTVILTSTPTPSLTPTPTPTPTPTLTPTPTPTPTPVVVTGYAPSNLSIYSCPGERFQTSLWVPSQTPFIILGWTDQDGSTWFLIQDNPLESQEWIRYGPEVSITPPNYGNYVLGNIACRVLPPPSE